MQISINTEQITDENIRHQFEQIISTLNLHNQKEQSTNREKPTGEDTPRAMRAWAVENGYKVGKRGQVPQHIVNIYKDAHTLVSPNRHTPKAKRAWAIENGYEVGTRGRLTTEIHTAYNAHHGLPAPEKEIRKKGVCLGKKAPIVRAWAIGKGFLKAGSRGRIATSIINAYNAENAHKGFEITTLTIPTVQKAERGVLATA